MTLFKKTRLMNLIGGWTLAVTGVALFFNKFDSQSIVVLVAIIGMYGVFCGTAFGSARALVADSSQAFRRSMLRVNWFFVGFYLFGAVAIVVATIGTPDVMASMLSSLLPSSFAFVVPQLINIRALRSLLTTGAHEA